MNDNDIANSQTQYFSVACYILWCQDREILCTSFLSKENNNKKIYSGTAHAVIMAVQVQTFIVYLIVTLKSFKVIFK